MNITKNNLKSFLQKSVFLNRDYYTDEEVESLTDLIPGVSLSPFDSAKRVVLVSLSKTHSIDVVLDTYGDYTNMAVMDCGAKLYVTL